MSRRKAPLRLPSGAPRDPGAMELYESLAAMPRPWPLYLVEMYEAAVAAAVATGASYWVPEDTAAQVQAAARRSDPPGRRAWMAILRWGERPVRAWIADLSRPRPAPVDRQGGAARAPGRPGFFAKAPVDPSALPRVVRQNRPVPVWRAKVDVEPYTVDARTGPVPVLHAKMPDELRPVPRVPAQNRPAPVSALKVGVDSTGPVLSVPASAPQTVEEAWSASRVAAENEPAPASPRKTGVLASPRVRYVRVTRARRFSARLPIAYLKEKGHLSLEGGGETRAQTTVSQLEQTGQDDLTRPPPPMAGDDLGHGGHGHGEPRVVVRPTQTPPTVLPALFEAALAECAPAASLEPLEAPPVVEAPAPAAPPRPSVQAVPMQTRNDGATTRAQALADLRFVLDRTGLKGVATKLEAAGIRSVEALEALTEAEVRALPGIGAKTVTQLHRLVNIRFAADPDAGYRPTDVLQEAAWRAWREGYQAVFGLQPPMGDFRSGGRDRAAAEVLAERYLVMRDGELDEESVRAFRELFQAWLVSRKRRPPRSFWFARDDVPAFEVARRAEQEAVEGDVRPAYGKAKRRAVADLAERLDSYRHMADGTPIEQSPGHIHW